MQAHFVGADPEVFLVDGKGSFISSIDRITCPHTELHICNGKNEYYCP